MNTTTQTINRLEKIDYTATEMNQLREITTEIPADFKECADSLYKSLPLIKWTVGTKDQMIQAVAASVNNIRILASEVGKLIEASLDALIEVRTDAANASQKAKIHQEVRNELLPFLPRLIVKTPDIITFDSMAMEKAEFYKYAQKELTVAVRDLCIALQPYFSDLLKKRLVGYVQVHPKDAKVAQFNFCRKVVVQEQAGEHKSTDSDSTEQYTSGGNRWETERVTRTVTTTERDLVQLRLDGDHVHIGHGLDKKAWPASEVQMPDVVKKLVKVVSDPLRHHVSCLTMTMASEKIVEREVGKKQWTEVTKEEQVAREIIASGTLADPVIVIFEKFILAGWSARDLERK